MPDTGKSHITEHKRSNTHDAGERYNPEARSRGMEEVIFKPSRFNTLETSCRRLCGAGQDEKSGFKLRLRPFPQRYIHPMKFERFSTFVEIVQESENLFFHFQIHLSFAKGGNVLRHYIVI